jgi:hypothetical protein
MFPVYVPLTQIAPAPVDSKHANMSTDAVAFLPQKMADWRHCIPAFIQYLEAGFSASKITDQKTMVSKTQLAVTPAIADEVMDLFQNLPSAAGDTPFDELKRRLLARFTPTPEAKFKQLLFSCELGDLAPSALYRKMKGLNAKFLADEALMTLWKDKLPQTIQLHLTAQASATLEEKLQMADSLHVLAQQKQQVNEIASAPEDMAMQLEVLQRRIKQLEMGNKNSYQSQTRDSPINHQKPAYKPWQKNKNKKPPVQNQNWCYYHNVYGAKAYKCSAPCSFQRQPPRSGN